MDKASANLNESDGLPSHLVPEVSRESACVSSVPLRRSERILLMQASRNSFVPDVETKITSMQCAGTHSGMQLKFSTSASLSLDGKNIKACGSNNQKGKRKPARPRKFRAEQGNDSNKQIKCINSSIIGIGEPSNFSKENSEVVKGPIACPVWRGSFQSEKFGLLAGLTAHASEKASEEVFDLARHLPALLNLQLVPLLDVWPGFFSVSPPNDSMVDLNFFPENERNESAFNALLSHLLIHGLAMKTMVDDIVLLLLTSPHLPYENWRAGGKYYLWAVFSGKNAFFPRTKEPHLSASNNELIVGSNLLENAGTADDRNSCRNFDKEEEQTGEKRIKCMDLETRMKSIEMPLLVLENSDCAVLEKLVDSKASGKDQGRIVSGSPIRSMAENISQDQLPAERTVNEECGKCGSENQEHDAVGFQGGDFSLEGPDEGKTTCTTEWAGSQSIGASVFDMFQTFDDLNSEGISSADNSGKAERRYTVKPSLVSTLDAIIEKHGDIAQDCPLTSDEPLTHALESVCQAVKDMEAVSLDKLQKSFLQSLYSTISDAEFLKINVKWLRDRRDERHKKTIDLKKSKVMELQSDIQLLESEVAAMTAEGNRVRETLSSIKSKYRHFRHNSLVNGLI